jgi:hypothetical protein
MGKLSQRTQKAFNNGQLSQFEFPDGNYHALVTFDSKTVQGVLRPFKNYLGRMSKVVNLDGSDVTNSTPTSDSRAKFYRIRVKMNDVRALTSGGNPIVDYANSRAEVTHVALIKPNEDPLPAPQTTNGSNSDGGEDNGTGNNATDDKGYRMTNIANVAAILFGIYVLYQIYKGYKR